MRKSLIGKRVCSNQGVWMEVIKSYGNGKVDVRFDDGTILYEKAVGAFNKGALRHPDFKGSRAIVNVNDRIGVEVRNKSGYLMRCVAYRKKTDIDVLFVDSGQVVRSYWGNFISGATMKPVDYKIGECSIASNGQEMELIAFHTRTNVDVRFDDGTVVYHKQYQAFKSGKIGNPNKPFDFKKSLLGEIYKLKTGLTAEVIEYKRAGDITVLIRETGDTVKCNKNSLVTGTLNPYHRKQESFYVGQSNVMSCGLTATILESPDCGKSTIVEFEDGVVVTCRRNCFFNGSVKHPLFNLQTHDLQYKSLFIKKRAYRFGAQVNWYVIKEDGNMDILSTKEIVEYTN